MKNILFRLKQSLLMFHTNINLLFLQLVILITPFLLTIYLTRFEQRKPINSILF